jgi:hypothetical protein
MWTARTSSYGTEAIVLQGRTRTSPAGRLAQPAYLGLGDSVDPQRLDEIVDLARANALDVGLDHDRVEGPLGASAGLEQAREIGAARDLGDLELDGSDACVLGAGPGSRFDRRCGPS